jgi:predicted porin
MASRFGAKGETDLGNGLIGFGRYEWGVDFNGGSKVTSRSDPDDPDKDITVDSISTRHRFVGVKGDWGSVKLGRTYHTFYSFVVGPGDQPWWNSGIYQTAYVGRTDKAITYTGGSDSFAFGATAYMDRDSDEEAIDVYEVGASYTFGNDMVLALAARGTAGDFNQGGATIEGTMIGNGGDDTVGGVSLSGIMLGDFSMTFGGQVQDDDSSVLVDVGYNGFIFHAEAQQIDSDSPANTNGGSDQDPVMVMAGYTHSLGRKTTLWFEIASFDADSSNSNDDKTQFLATLKYDIM